MAPVLDLVRLFAGASVLAFASYTDWKWRRAPNVLWWILSGLGLALLLVEAFYDPAPLAAKWPYLLAVPAVLVLASESDRGDLLAGALAVLGIAAAVLVSRRSPDALTDMWPWLAAVPVFAALIYALHWLGLIAGGADAKAFIALGVLVPFPLALAEGLPAFQGPLPGFLTIFSDSLLAFLLVPLGFALWNVAHGDLRFPHLFLGMKRAARDVRQGHAWPMEVVDETGARRTKLFASRMSASEAEETFERVQALGDERVWVSPKIPFMLPLLVGFVLAFTAGELMLAGMQALVQR